ncbi:MAG TPA: Tol-Pal system beta propeller repeat protein TolB [Burkholderiales bacterium]|nr:Tol-Pal system beta propeller repeat protein TolB [Burkholderiales bacterium]
MSLRTFAPFLAAILLFAGPARAQLTIEIIGGGANQIPVAVLPFVGESALPQSVSEIVEQDLTRSGRFRTIFVGGVNPLPSEAAQVNFADWKSRLADALIIGQAQRLPDGRFEVRFRLLDVPKQVQLGGVAYTFPAAELRLTAHKVADYIYEKLTGERGVFTTRIAYVVKQGTRYELRVADADGQNASSMVISSEPIMSPAWSPDGTRMAYVSFQNKKPILFVQSLAASKQPAPVANYRGSNSAPAWSPDGKQLAAVLTRDGTSQIYLMNADGGNLRRLTTSATIDTEPFFTPDGQSIYFTSDRGGSPQIYRMAASGGDATRITFDGDYNVSPRVSPDGKTLAYISRISGRFQLMAMDLESKQILALTDGQRDESPSFAPNGRIILYASDNDNRGVLAAVSSDGRFKQRLGIQAADIREPAWGPFLGR